jgi:hypothetical protein
VKGWRAGGDGATQTDGLLHLPPSYIQVYVEVVERSGRYPFTLREEPEENVLQSR